MRYKPWYSSPASASPLSSWFCLFLTSLSKQPTFPITKSGLWLLSTPSLRWTHVFVALCERSYPSMFYWMISRKDTQKRCLSILASLCSSSILMCSVKSAWPMVLFIGRHLFPPVDLYLNFEKSSWKSQVRWTVFLACKNEYWNWFLQATQAVKIQFEID